MYIRSLFLAGLLLFATKWIAGQEIVSFKGDVDFLSDAPLELIQASSDQLVGVINLKGKSFAFSVVIKSFQGFNSALQREHFNENYMESTRYEKATYSGKILDDIPMSKDGTYEIRTKGNLIIHGITKERILKHKVIINNGAMSIESKFIVPLEDHNISIPKIVHKKIAEEIQVTLWAKGNISS